MITANKLYLPAWLARLCLRATIEKGVGHKYVRREPTGDPKKPWRYYYNLTSGRGHLDTSKIRDGAKFKIADGHVHITKLDGEHAEVVHDETGETARMHVHDLADLIHSHHGEEIERVSQRQQKFDLRRRQRIAEKKSRRAMSLPRSDRAISTAIENEIGHDFGSIDMDDQRVRDKIESIFPKSRANKIRHFHDLVSELVKQARKNNEVRTWADLRDARIGGRLAGTDTIFDVIREIGDEIDDEQLKRATIPAEAQDEILRREEEQHYRDQYGDDEEGDAREPEDGDTSFDPEMFKSFRIPSWLAKALEHVVEKAAGHKYLRRVPTGNPKRPWRYYYRVTGGKHLAHDDEIVAGSAFRAKDGDKEGHFHVVGVDGDNVTVRHDETGREATMKREALRAMLHAEHIEKINAAVKWATETRDAAEKHGSEKQKARARKHAEGVVGAFVKPEPKPEPAPAVDDAKDVSKALYQAGRELENTSPNMRDFYVKPSGGQPEFKRAVEQHNAWQRAIKDLRGALAEGEKITPDMLASATKARDQIQAMIAHANEAIRAKKAREVPNDVPNPAGAELPTFHMNGTPASRVVEGLTPALEALSRAIDGAQPAEAAPEPAPEKPAAKERKPRAKAEKAVTDVPKVQGLDGKLTSVGEHVWGSRKDLASVGRIESSKDLETMSYADAAAIVTKARILEPLTLEQAKGLGMSPGVAHMGLAMLAAIRAKPDDSKAGRAAFVDDVRAVQGMLKSVKTLDEFNSAVSEMRYAQRRAKDYTIVEKVADSTYGLDRDAAFARAKELTKQTGEKHEVRSGFGVGVVITKNAPRPFDSLGRTFGAFISGNRDSKVWNDAYTQALTLDNKWDRGAGMTPDQAWAWLEASNKADAKPAEKKPAAKSKAGETKRGWSGAKDFAGEVGRRGGKVTVDGADAKRTAETFGLREIDYGRDGYMTQADREYHTKALEEALHDFSEILGVDPKNLSFKGRLGIALGADGKGGRAKAHYETGRRQINITKFRGGGSLAHEWGHAMDNIIAGHYIENTKGSADGAYLSDAPDHPELPSDVREAISDVMQAILKHPDPAKARAQHAARSKDLRKVHKDLVAKNNALVSEHTKIAQMPDSPKAAEARIARLESSIAWHEKEKASEEAKLARAEERTNSASTIERQRALLAASSAESAVRAYASNIQSFKADIERLRRGEGIRTPEQSERMAAIEKEVEALRPEINRASKALKAHDTSDPLVSDYAHAGMLLGADYWGSDRELFARAFESYVQDQLADAKRANTYLVAGTTVQYPTNIPHPNGGDAQPYPQGEERKRINDAMHVLVRVIHQGKHIEKALAALDAFFGPEGIEKSMESTGRFERLPRHLGSVIWKALGAEDLEKGATHKYIRRVPTGNPKRPWRYYYRVTGGKQLGHEDEMIVGAAFAVKNADQAGHFHIRAVEGDKLTIEHDETGHRETITKDKFRELLHNEHVEAIRGARERAEKTAAEAAQYGSEKQKSKTREYAEKLRDAFEPKPKKPKLERKDMTAENVTERLQGDELLEALTQMGDALYGVDDVRELNGVGLNKLDHASWPGARTAERMQRILRKYKRQLVGQFGELYFQAGLGDRTEAVDGTVGSPRWTPRGDLVITIQGFIPKAKFGDYTALQRQYGLQFNGAERAWFVPAAKVEDFKVLDYQDAMKRLGITVKDPPEMPAEKKAEIKQQIEVEKTRKMTANEVRDGIVARRIRDKIAVVRKPDGRFAFYAPFSEKFNNLFSNKTGQLTGITEYNKADNHARETFDLALVEEAIDKLRALHPDWEIVTSGVEEAKRERERRDAELRQPIPEVQKHLAPNISLFPYQNEMVRFLEKTNGNALIGDEMGLGKTMQSLAYCAAHGRKAIVVCPKVVRRTWVEEAAKFFPGRFQSKELRSKDLKRGMPDLKGLDLVTVNYESLEKFAPALADAGFDTIIVDESHRIKNPKAKTTQAVTRIAKKMSHRILLSGTAVKNRKEELYTQLELVRPGLFSSAEELKGATIGGTWNKMRDVYLARQKSSVLKDLPEKTTTITKLEVPGAPDLAPKSLARSAFGPEDAEIARREAIADAAEDGKDLRENNVGEYSRLKADLAIAKAPATTEMVQDILDSSDSKVLVFSDSVEAAKAIVEKLGDVAILHHGQMSDDKREAAKKEFQNPETSKRVFVSTRQSLAVGATLTAADKVVFNDLPWTAADVRQAEDRAHRVGQKNAVNVYWVTVQGNAFDEGIADLVKRKYDLSKKINEGKQLSEAERKWMQKPIAIDEIRARIRGEQVGPEVAGEAEVTKALDAIEKGHQDMITVRIPAHLGALLWKAQSDAIEKGAGHKYLRRVPTGNPKKPYRYYYRVTGGKLLGHDDEMIVGAAFAVKHGDKAGHFHVKAIDGDKITIEHDESGHRETVTRDGLRAMLHAEHAEAIGTARTRAKAAADAAEKHGATEKMKSKTASAAEKLEAHFDKKKPAKGKHLTFERDVVLSNPAFSAGVASGSKDGKVPGKIRFETTVDPEKGHVTSVYINGEIAARDMNTKNTTDKKTWVHTRGILVEMAAERIGSGKNAFVHDLRSILSDFYDSLHGSKPSPAEKDAPKAEKKNAPKAEKLEAHFGEKPAKGATAIKEDEEFDGKYSSDDLKAATAYALERETAELRAKYGSPVRLRNMKAKLDAVHARYKDLPKGVRSALDAIDEAKAMLAVKGKRTTQISVREAVQHVHPEVTRTLEEDFKANEPKAEKKDETKAKKKDAPKAEEKKPEIKEIKVEPEKFEQPAKPEYDTLQTGMYLEEPGTLFRNGKTKQVVVVLASRYVRMRGFRDDQAFSGRPVEMRVRTATQEEADLYAKFRAGRKAFEEWKGLTPDEKEVTKKPEDPEPPKVDVSGEPGFPEDEGEQPAASLAQSRLIRLSGKTFDAKDEIKKLGAKWNGELKVWEIKTADHNTMNGRAALSDALFRLKKRGVQHELLKAHGAKENETMNDTIEKSDMLYSGEKLSWWMRRYQGTPFLAEALKLERESMEAMAEVNATMDDGSATERAAATLKRAEVDSTYRKAKDQLAIRYVKWLESQAASSGSVAAEPDPTPGLPVALPMMEKALGAPSSLTAPSGRDIALEMLRDRLTATAGAELGRKAIVVNRAARR